MACCTHTPAYVVQEVFSKKGYDGAKSDIWSCGIVLYVLLSGYLPFQHENVMKIFKAEFVFPPWISMDAKKLISRVLIAEDDKRITFSSIMKNPWFRKGFDREFSRLQILFGNLATMAKKLNFGVSSAKEFKVRMERKVGGAGKGSWRRFTRWRKRKQRTGFNGQTHDKKLLNAKLEGLEENAKPKLEECEKEKKLLLGKVEILEENIIKLQMDLRERNDEAAGGRDMNKTLL
ncbi:hypothetical protein Q3G72_008881 [Acer saccharum]|nr:hypothetical protein Q3G72_008881 [Acer saccharum]